MSLIYLDDAFRSRAEETIAVVFQQIENLEIVCVVRSLVTEIYQRVIGAFSFLYDQLTSLFHFSKIASHLSSDTNQAIAEITDQIAADIFIHPESLNALGEVLPVVMSATNSYNVLALTSTCKALWHNRWELIAHHPVIISKIFNMALREDCALDNSLTGLYRKVVYSLFGKDVASNVKNILSLFPHNAYQTELSLVTPLVSGHRQMTVDLVKEILKQFPKTAAIWFNHHDNISEKHFTEILALCPSLKHMKGEFPNANWGVNWHISFPKTLESMDLMAAGLSKIKRIKGSSVRQLLTDCKGLQVLNLEGYKKLNSLKFADISISNTLKKIDLGETNINDANFLHMVTACPQLETLDIYSCVDITPQGFINTLFPATLLSCYLEKTKVDDNGLMHITQSCCKLLLLSLQGCRHITFQGFINALFPATLRYLDLENTQINNDGFKRIIRTCRELQTLFINGCDAITSQGISKVDFPKTLRKIWVGGIADEGLQKILWDCTELEELAFNHCRRISAQIFMNEDFPITLKVLRLPDSKITDAGLQRVLNRCSELEELSLNNCYTITAQGFADAHFPKNLKRLSLDRTSIDFKTVQNIVSACPYLSVVTLFGCPAIFSIDLAHLRLLYKDVRFLPQ